eukprot:TRINITY_DN2482_c0_g1_i15.p1 TRINITY_DN2482_c0_g1~~TRINITY_DN2482_c0_g1_i15.p1  ORF type:complete len:516 (+),score=77.64 TRINITY_DN2482_c0_g1_i15:1405-2952(+)
MSLGHWKYAVDLIAQAEEYVDNRQLPADLVANYGICKIYMKELTAASMSFKKLRSEECAVSSYPDLFYEIAQTYYRVNEPGLALNYYRELEEVEAYNQPALWFREATCLTETGQYNAAIGLYQRILDASPDTEEAVLAMADLYNKLNENQKAIEVVNMYLENREDFGGSMEEVVETTEKFTNDLQSRDQAIGVVVQKAFNHFSCGEYEIFIHLCLPILNDTSLRTGIFRRLKTARTCEQERHPTGQKGQSIVELLGMSRYFQLLAKIGVSLIWCGRGGEAGELLEIHCTYVRRLEDYCFDSVQSRSLKWIICKAYLSCKDYREAMRYVRQLCSSNPTSVGVWNTYHLLAILTRDKVSNSKFLNRLMASHPRSLPLLMAYGHHYHTTGSYKLALDKYVEAYKVDPKLPIVLLCIGVCYLNQSMSRTTAERHLTVLNAFAYFQKYYVLSKRSMEATYNLARAFHQIGLFYLSIPLYNKVIWSDSDMKKEAAFNLSLIYRSSGSTELARKVLMENIVI